VDEIASGGKLISLKKIEANRRNAKLSTGPRTERGKRWSRRNAITHGVLASALLITDGGTEDTAEFRKLVSRLTTDLEPVGNLEEMMVEKIAVCWWRLQSALRFEAEAIRRARREEHHTGPEPPNDAELLELLATMQAEEKEARTRDSSLPEHFRGVEVARRRQEVLTHWHRRRGVGTAQNVELPAEQVNSDAVPEHSSAATAESRAAEVSAPHDCSFALPAEKDLQRILKYEASIHRQLAHALNQLERLQRQRRGEHVPAPVNVNLLRDE